MNPFSPILYHSIQFCQVNHEKFYLFTFESFFICSSYNLSHISSSHHSSYLLMVGFFGVIDLIFSLLFLTSSAKPKSKFEAAIYFTSFLTPGLSTFGSGTYFGFFFGTFNICSTLSKSFRFIIILLSGSSEKSYRTIWFASNI